MKKYGLFACLFGIALAYTAYELIIRKEEFSFEATLLPLMGFIIAGIIFAINRRSDKQ